MEGELYTSSTRLDDLFYQCYSLTVLPNSKIARNETMKFITLLTDFGLRDGYVGVMKGVIYGIAPHAQIADISHTISPQNIMEGALALGRVVPYFPPGTVHIAVVDPGVGTARRPIAARIGAHYFVGPDNGLFTVVLERAERSGEHISIVVLDRPRFWLPNVSNVFHGRDIFSPAGAHLANEIPLEDIGTPIENIARLEIPRVEQSDNGFRGQVTSIDHFGNLATNIMREHLAGMPLKNIRVSLAGVEIPGLVNTFGDRSPGDLIALFGTSNDLTISVVNGSAAERLNVRVGEPVEVSGG
jgi:S-adenosyl-L-methionine hydrolase (adenosine-forming)